MQSPALLPAQRGADDQPCHLQQVAQFDEVGRHAEIAVIFINLLRQQVDAMKRPFQPLRGADDADIVPHETANLPPVMLDDDFLVAIGDTAFVPCPDRWGKRQAVPVGMDVPGRRFAKDKAFQQRRSEEHTSELQSLMRSSYAVICLKKKKHNKQKTHTLNNQTHKK